MNLTFPQKISLAQLPTPFLPLDNLSAICGGPRIWVKRDDLTEFGAGGNKIRKLEFVFAQALAQGASVVITCGGIQSNHCRATALMAAKLGLKCHLILRGQAPPVLDANTLVAQLAGAKLSFYPLSEYQHLTKLFERWVEHYSGVGDVPFAIPTGASDEIGLWGYIGAAQETLDDISRNQLTNVHVCCATGSGGTHAGLALGFSVACGPSLTAYAVCDSERYFKNKAREDYMAWCKRYGVDEAITDFPLDVCDQFIGPGYAKSYPELMETIELVAKTEGLLLDPVYTGKAFHGMLQHIKEGRYNNKEHLVFVHTGGVFGLFPFRGDFNEAN